VSFWRWDALGGFGKTSEMVSTLATNTFAARSGHGTGVTDDEEVGFLGVFRDCSVCGKVVLTLWREDGDYRETQCSEHSSKLGCPDLGCHITDQSENLETDETGEARCPIHKMHLVPV
jgi:hypothetical protein